MDVLILLLFIGIVLATTGVVFFVWNVLQLGHQHSDRLALLPLDDDRSRPAPKKRPRRHS